MSKMISVASGFQYSVNIGYDLNNDDKLKNFIPTKSALTLLKDILSSTAPDATERARVLVGAYGKGKSHIILTILSMLMQRKHSLFTHLMPKINEDPELKQLVDNYYSVQVFLTVQNDQFIQKIAVINELTAIVPAACFYTAGRNEIRFSGSCDSINANILSVLRKVEFKYLLYCSIVIDPPVSGLQIFCQRTFIDQAAESQIGFKTPV